MNLTNPRMITSVKLGEVCRFKGGSGFREALQGSKSGQYPFIKVSDMELLCNRKYIVDANNWIDKKTLVRESITIFPVHSVVFAKVGAALLLNRRRILTRETAIDNNMMGAIPEKIEPDFLFYVLLNIDFSNFVQSGAVPSINQAQISNIETILPCSAEQTQIATILSTIDRAIEQTEALIAKQQRIKTGLMQDLLTKGIDENGNIRSEETHEFKDSPLGRIPVEWEVVTTGQVTKSLVPGRDKPDLDGGGVPWITIPDIEGMYLDLPKSGLSLSLNAIKVANARLMPKGTVLMSCVGEFGIATITECDAVANQQLHGFICDQSILPEWLIAQINASGNRIDNMATQTTIKYLNKNGCESILITLPSLKEQVKIISILDNINDLFEKQKKSLNKLRSLKTGLMQDLLTGKVRVIDLLNQKIAAN